MGEHTLYRSFYWGFCGVLNEVDGIEGRQEDARAGGRVCPALGEVVVDLPRRR